MKDEQPAGLIEAANSLKYILDMAQDKGVKVVLRKVVGLL